MALALARVDALTATTGLKAIIDEEVVRHLDRAREQVGPAPSDALLGEGATTEPEELSELMMV